jgi:cytochrome c
MKLIPQMPRRMASGALILAAGMSIGAAATADEPVGFQNGMKLLTKYNCRTCHSVDKPMAGPSLHDIAKKYSSDPHARGVLSESIVNGSSGVWGTVPMPPTKIPDSDLKPLVEWILSLSNN